MSKQTLVVPVEWKADDEDANLLEGYASTFGNVDLQFDVVAQGAFKNTLARVRKGEVPLLADHMASVRNVLGTLVEASEDAKGLRIKARFASDPDAQAIRQKMLDGHVSKMSIGYEPMQWRYETRDNDTRVRVLEDVKLWEVSAVVFPANPEAVIDRVKSAVRETIDTVVAGAVASGGDEREIKAALSEWMSAATKDGAPGVVEPPVPPDGKADSTATTHLETGKTATPEGAEPGKGTGPDSLTLKMRQAENLLAGRDPDETADPVKVAGTATRLELLEDWLERSNREVELTDQLEELRNHR